MEENNPIWDKVKEKIFNQVDLGTFDFENITLNAPLGDHWWKTINENGETCGFAWGDYTSNGFEISLVVGEEYRRDGLGSQIIEELEHIVKCQGVYNMVAIIQSTNPNAVKMIDWLYSKGYKLIFTNTLKTKEFATNLAKRQMVDLELVKELS